jgi:hypothetical protein
MSRRAILAVALGSLIALSMFQARAQTFSRGVPATAMSPEPDGRQHGVPASALSPVPPPQNGVHGQRQFGNTFVNRGPRQRFGTHRNRGNTFVPVPVFYPIYGYGDPSYPVADPYVPAPQDQAANSAANEANDANAEDAAPASSDHELQAAYLQGARDALAHERDKIRHSDGDADTHDVPSSRRKEARSDPPAEAAPQPVREDNSPATVFIFKDGHQIETKNFAIVGQTLYDFSNTGLKKVQLADMDKEATTKANDDRGITVKLP